MDDFEAFARAVEAGVLRYDPGGEITAADSTVESQTGYARGELCGMDVREVFREDDLSLELSDLEEGEASGTRTEVLTNHGATYPVGVRATTLPGTDELLLVVDDLREHVQRERYLRFARDVNELVIRADDESTLLRKVVDLILEPPPLREFDIVPMAEECLTEARRDHPHATFTADLPESAEVVAIRETRRGLEGLLENAVVHSDRETPEIGLSVGHGEGVVRLEVSDDGPGIPEVEREVLTTEKDVGPLEHGSGLAL